MGRPPLKATSITKPTMVRLTDDVRQRIEVLAGPNRMAEFIREAVESELKRRETARAKAPKPKPE
jgi:predicted DNA-binding protein